MGPGQDEKNVNLLAFLAGPRVFASRGCNRPLIRQESQCRLCNDGRARAQVAERRNPTDSHPPWEGCLWSSLDPTTDVFGLVQFGQIPRPLFASTSQRKIVWLSNSFSGFSGRTGQSEPPPSQIWCRPARPSRLRRSLLS